MTAVLLATLSAFLFGSTDFVGGLLSRRAPAWAVTSAGLLGATVVTGLLALLVPGSPTGTDFALTTVGGVGGGVAMAFVYRGLSKGRMGVVAPTSALGTTVISVLGGLVVGDRPAVLVWCGVLLAVPAIVLVSREAPTTTPGDPETVPAMAGVVDGLIGSVGAGLMFVTIDRLSGSAGWWPLTWMQAVSLVTVVVMAVLFGQPWLPRSRAGFLGATTGPLAAIAGIVFLGATRHGELVVAGVITSLYPAATVLLAVAVLRERVHRAQGAGLALCVVAISCVALG